MAHQPEPPVAAPVETLARSDFERLLDQAVARVERAAAPQVQPMELRSFDELLRWAEMAARTHQVPRDYQGRPDDIVLAVQFGAEVGLRPLQSLWSIVTINGRPSIYGDAMLALCKTHPAYVSIEETLIGAGEKMEARCVVVRRREPAFVSTYSVDDAKTAKLWGKKGASGQDTPWITNPKRMLQFRARGFALRDAFPDKLRGLISAEEASDYTPLPETPRPPISAAPPPPPAATNGTKKPTVSEWIDARALEIAALQTEDEWKAYTERRDIAKARDGALKGSAKEKFDELLTAALDRITGVDTGAADRLSGQIET